MIPQTYQQQVLSHIDNFLNPSVPFTAAEKDKIFNIVHQILLGVRTFIGSQRISNDWSEDNEKKNLVVEVKTNAPYIYDELFELVNHVLGLNPAVQKYLDEELPEHFKSPLRGSLNPHRISFVECHSVEALQLSLNDLMQDHYKKIKLG